VKVVVRSIGPLAAALGGKEVAVEVSDGASLAALLSHLARGRPEVANWIARPDALQVFRSRSPLRGEEPLRDGDLLDLVVAVAGG
jgi:molybdopterin converting factor small subunit